MSKSKKQRYKIVEVNYKEKGKSARKFFVIYRKRWFGWVLHAGRFSDGEPKKRYTTLKNALSGINQWHVRLYDDYYTKAFNKKNTVKEIELDIINPLPPLTKDSE